LKCSIASIVVLNVWRSSPCKTPFVDARSSSINTCLLLMFHGIACAAGALGAAGAAAAELDDAAAPLDDTAGRAAAPRPDESLSGAFNLTR
jgi:hypothetical protein